MYVHLDLTSKEQSVGYTGNTGCTVMFHNLTVSACHTLMSHFTFHNACCMLNALIIIPLADLPGLDLDRRKVSNDSQTLLIS